jgi:ribosomal protein S18 acetylase RimI-like enzyme
MEIRKATEADLAGAAAVYERVHDAEEAGLTHTGWVRGVYPTRATAEAALAAGEFYVLEDEGRILAAMRVNAEQGEVYAKCPWSIPAEDDKVLVLHTLAVDPTCGKHGCGTAMVKFYEDLARARGCTALRIDTNVTNTRARAFYAKLGFREAGIFACEFNGIEGVSLVCLEKGVG